MMEAFGQGSTLGVDMEPVGGGSDVRIPAELAYACFHWPFHLFASGEKFGQAYFKTLVRNQANWLWTMVRASDNEYFVRHQTNDSLSLLAANSVVSA